MDRKTLGRLALFVGALTVPRCALAEPPWPAGIYSYVVVNQDLRDVLRQFGVNTGLRVALSDKVQGRVYGPMPSLPPRQFLDSLTQQFGLEWVYDGSIISVSSISESQTEMLPLQDVPFGKLYDGLEKAGLLDARYQFRPVMNGRTALISGPPRYISLAHDGFAAIMADKPAPSPPTPVVALLNAPPPRSLEIMRGVSSSIVEFK